MEGTIFLKLYYEYGNVNVPVKLIGAAIAMPIGFSEEAHDVSIMHVGRKREGKPDRTPDEIMGFIIATLNHDKLKGVAKVVVESYEEDVEPLLGYCLMNDKKIPECINTLGLPPWKRLVFPVGGIILGITKRIMNQFFIDRKQDIQLLEYANEYGVGMEALIFSYQKITQYPYGFRVKLTIK